MPQQRTSYKITNWSSYNKSLVNRGRITLWLEADLDFHWLATPTRGKRGRSLTYSAVAMQMCLTVKCLYGLTYRATQGFMESFFAHHGIMLSCPCYTQMQRRSATLGMVGKPIGRHRGAIDIVVDSTGLKVYGEGEWKVRQHGVGKRRTWQKLHLAIDPLTQEIVGWKDTGNDTHDSEVLSDLVAQATAEEQVVERCLGDGAYDTRSCYEACAERHISLVTPPRRDAVVSDPEKPVAALKNRDRAIERIQTLTERWGDREQARKQWKAEVDYHTRSLAETAMFRFKTLCGETLCSRKEATQHTELAIKINLLNQFTRCGMPESVPVTR